MAYTEDGRLLQELTIADILQPSENYQWYWVDIQEPTPEEKKILEEFSFHPLAIKDCIHHFQRPKLDPYDNYYFLVFNSFHPTSLEPLEIDLFLGDKYIVSFHFHRHLEIDEVWDRMIQGVAPRDSGVQYILYKLFDKIVDSFFPVAQRLEDQLTHLETRPSYSEVSSMMGRVFQIRRKLLKLRHIIWPMRDLVYRMLATQRLAGDIELKRFMMDIQDHLQKLASMIDSSREIASDIRDNYMSLNSHRMNTIMMRLTLITTIFMPLSFIAGLYGMNFEYMPELTHPYGYFIVLAVMFLITIVLYIHFRRKGWFGKK